MATIKSFTDISQSKKLAEFLPIESADMVLWGKDFKSVCADMHAQEFMKGLECRKMDYVPAWSLAALLGVLPKFIGDYSKCLYYDVDGCYCGYMNDGDFMLTIKETKAGNPVDACVKMIERLHELNLL